MDLPKILESTLIIAPPLVLAITLHEVAHGWVAKFYGDRTAELQGRLTLNPLRHVDPIGTVLVPALQFLTLGFAFFGWAKPVPVNASQLHRPRQDMVKVAAAGPAANVLMATGWAVVLAIAARLGGSSGEEPLIATMAAYGVYMNLLLALFNLLPIPPLDGGRVLTNLLPAGGARNLLERAERWGFLIVVVLLVSHALDPLFSLLQRAVFVDLLPSIAGSA